MCKTVAVLLLALAISVYADEAFKPLKAVVRLTPDAKFLAHNITGLLTIEQAQPNGPITINGKIHNLTEGLHGFHIHEKGDLRDGCVSAGPHFNPKQVNHGAPGDAVRHVGDLGNVKSEKNGVTTINITDSIALLNGGHSILGRSIVVHALPDDLGKGNHTLSSTTGNAGDRLACGVIGIA